MFIRCKGVAAERRPRIYKDSQWVSCLTRSIVGFSACSYSIDSFFVKRQGFVLQIVNQAEYNICPKTYCKDVNRRVDVPAKPLRELFKYNDRGAAGSYKEHIHVLA